MLAEAARQGILGRPVLRTRHRCTHCLVGAGGGIAPAVAAGDGVHLNAEGHRRLFERVRAAIVSGRRIAPTH